MYRILFLAGLMSLLAGGSMAQEDDLLKRLGEEETRP